MSTHQDMVSDTHSTPCTWHESFKAYSANHHRPPYTQQLAYSGHLSSPPHPLWPNYGRVILILVAHHLAGIHSGPTIRPITLLAHHLADHTLGPPAGQSQSVIARQLAVHAHGPPVGRSHSWPAHWPLTRASPDGLTTSVHESVWAKVRPAPSLDRTNAAVKIGRPRPSLEGDYHARDRE